MLYILRLTDGDCIVVLASDEQSARQAAASLHTGDKANDIVSVRSLDNFGVRFSPTDDGSLQVDHWNDADLDGILANEYPLLNEAYRRANAEPFGNPGNQEESILVHLKTGYEHNTAIIREGLERERQRFGTDVSAAKSLAVRANQ